MARKKIVFIIVEGPSDEVALGAVLSKVFDSSSVYVHIMFGDITTQSMAGNKTIVSSIGMVSCLWQLINKPEASAGCFRFFYSMPKAYRKNASGMHWSYIPEAPVFYAGRRESNFIL